MSCIHQTGFSTGSEESGGNGFSGFVGDGFGQAKDTSKEDESRGTQVCITMAVVIPSIASYPRNHMVIYTSQFPVSDEGVGEQHGAGFVTQANAILDEEEASDDIGQAKNTSKEDESRGSIQVCITIMAVAILSII